MRRYFLSLALLATTVSFAQRPQNPTPSPAPGTPGTGAPAITGIPGFGGAAPRTAPRPYNDVITGKAITKKGLFTVHKIDEKYYFEIADSILGREILSVVRFVKVPAGAGYGGSMANGRGQMIRFEKGPSNTIFLRTVTLVNTSDKDQDINKAVDLSNLNAIANAFPIAAFSKDSSGVVIDVTDFFKGDNQAVSISPSTKRGLNLGILSADRSFINKISTYPINTEIKSVKTYTASPSLGGFGAPAFPGAPTLIQAANEAGAITVELNTSLLLLPKVPMERRIADKRVGFFTRNYVKFSDNQQEVERIEFAVRWRLEPKDGEWEKWRKGELVEPKKPIVYYVDPATPKQWRKHLIAGVNDWQAAFEKAGFKNAIMGKEWPENDTTMSMEDARFSVIRYLASDIENASGPNNNDPRSGEILESHIQWYHNVMKLVHDWYMVQTAAVDPGARKMKYDDDLMGDLIRFVSSHEVGHTLGLYHNMGSSSKTPVEKLRDKAWVEANGHTASIMDYARFNYVAQPEDNISRKGLYPRIGDYDKWAMKWGYGYIPGNSEEERKTNSSKMITAALKENPRHWFGTYEQGNSADPRSQSEDLSDNAVKASEYGIMNLKRVLKGLPEWTKEENDQYKNISVMYGQVLGQFRRYMGHVTANVGGVYETFKVAEQNEAVYEITPKTRQKEAVAFLNKQIFETPNWLIDRELWNKFNNPVSNDPIMSTQDAVLGSLISPTKLGRLQLASNRFGADKAYNAMELLNDVQTGLFSELSSKKTIDQYRRLLQMSYVDKLVAILNPPTTAGVTIITLGGRGGGASIDLNKSDVPAIVRAQLVALRTQINSSAAGFGDKLSKIHLQNLSERIKRSLDPK
ncbi:MAG: zinc-dependent metalloprotease [Bacteroidetes bacterium 24-39-8]|nr:MAG: zinc-dependent metalloprotease [Sphingobacteriia bacterium 35-40-8]OYZ52525.1 MAG: zinc-dependent metalloprotease [Bacteroidetes bacterium 24-39-8]OZA62871.1 MAG: zinc-dependent metalloprotease [Sphingobacteriia bacterium 39-39-8]HQR92204.1 zinc-dependent metalloprotease [Sediminibacterium sp.]HQS54046.1 zinc-dependent metalloprotease [Sediminibacterium sp.]